MMNEEQLQAIEERYTRDYGELPSAARADVPALVAEVRRLQALVDSAPEYAAYVHMALATFDTPMTLEEWYADGEADMAQDGAA